MKSYLKILNNSWIQEPVSCHKLAQIVAIPLPTSVNVLLTKLEQPETLTVRTDVITPDGFPLGGHVEMTLSSNGNYSFRGNMRATGFTSYHFGLQVFVKAADGVILTAFHSGKVFGFDTPGDRDNTWEENLTAPVIADRWLSIRNNPRIEYEVHADIGGVLGTFWDIIKIGIKTLVAYAVTGPTGAILVLGNEFGAAVGLPTPQGLVAGIVVAEGIILIFGTYVIVAAVVVGAAAGIALELVIKNRLLREEEKEFARLIFGNVLDQKFREEKVWITNLSHDGGRKYTFPSIDGSILLNMNDAYDDPIHYVDPKVGSDYSQPGSVFVHELAHACQIAANKFVPGMICTGSGTYTYHAGSAESDRKTDKSWTTRSWTDQFTREQQAHLIDDWYGANCKAFSSMQELSVNLNSPTALQDLAFPFISKCRAGIF